jgi:hypothetical protein
MTEARIHPHGGPKTLTPAQRETADRLIADDIYVYTEKVQGKGIVAAWRRYLESGDSSKITDALYRFIELKCGYIAHFDLHGFRAYYRDAAKMLDGELYPSVWRKGGSGGPVAHSASVYTDGLSDQDVYGQMVAIAEELRAMVLERASLAARVDELTVAATLAAKHGFKLTAR